jgi:opacity protein-like surface antigen
MKIRSVLLTSAMLAALPVVASAEPTESWYVSVGFGANWMDDVEDIVLHSTGSATAGPFDVGLDTGWAVDGAVGYKWDMLRLEFELAYRANDTEELNDSGTIEPSNGEVTSFAQMLNVIFDIPIGETVGLSLGAGLGGALVDVGMTAGGAGTLVANDDDYVFAYQGIAGLSLDVGERTQLFAEYRYFATSEATIRGVFVGTPFDTDDVETDNHTGLIGLRYYFSEPAPMAEPTPEPAPAPVTNYTIYFNKKGALSAEAHGTLAEAADTHKGGAPVVTIEAVGGGPRAGDAVTRALVDLGVAAEKIAVDSRGDDATITITQ